MYYAYVLTSIDHDYYYKGHCANLERLKQHNLGMTRSIAPFIPFEIAYSEALLTLEEAVSREEYFKSAAGRRYLKKVMAS